MEHAIDGDVADAHTDRESSEAWGARRGWSPAAQIIQSTSQGRARVGRK
jgi:hypothetical protein